MANPNPKHRQAGGQNAQQPSTGSFLMLFVVLLILNYWIMKTFFPQKPQVPANEPQTVAAIEKSVMEQEAEPFEAGEAPAEKPAETIEAAKENAEKPDAAATEKPAENPEAPATETPAENPAAPSTEAPAENPTAETPAAPTDENPTETPAAPATEEAKPATAEPAEQLYTLGSADPASPYRMVVTLSNRGASVTCVELNEKRLGSMSDAPDFKGGTLGTLAFGAQLPEPEAVGFHVQVIPPGTPAEAAGLKVGDYITKFNDEPTPTAYALAEAARKLRPGTEVTVTFKRDGDEQTVKATLSREPVKLIQPELGTMSFGTTLAKFGKMALDTPNVEMGDKIKTKTGDVELFRYLDMELPNIAMRTKCWEVEDVAADGSSLTFVHRIPHYGLEIRKTYTLVKVAEADRKNEAAQVYHLTLNVSVKNVGQTERSLSVQQDGPTGLPTEGYWFCSKVSRGWGAVGIRDVAIGFANSKTPTLVGCHDIAKGNWGVYEKNETRPINYIGVDAQYFSALMIPDVTEGNVGIQQYTSLLAGWVDEKWVTKTNTSCRLRLNECTLKPGETSSQSFTIFLGPKRPRLLQAYGVSNLLYYGWFSFVAIPMVGLLHFFYGFVGNYGIAILMLTIVVRLLMFPLSRKQTMGMITMQKLQPEMKKIQEKYEDPMERQKAQMELFRKYKYNPMSGCWVMLIQLPLFIGLYRALLVDVELRHAPLFSETIRFCSNLAAPDMLLYWKDWVWETIGSGYGFFGLGPYFNLLPVLTIVLFIAQQKLFMPPPADDQARMQQKMMSWMMIFFGFCFFKVPSGLCFYFIISSLWGLLERRFMPKAEDMELVPGGIIDVKSRVPGEDPRKDAKKDAAPKKETWLGKLQRLADEEMKTQSTKADRRKDRDRK